MGAPGLEHEARREVLDALTVLAGFETSVEFPRVRPDVHRRRRSDSAWFVGEAKATERADDATVTERLEAYRDACTRSGAPDFFVLSVRRTSASVGPGRSLTCSAPTASQSPQWSVNPRSPGPGTPPRRDRGSGGDSPGTSA